MVNLAGELLDFGLGVWSVEDAYVAIGVWRCVVGLGGRCLVLNEVVIVLVIKLVDFGDCVVFKFLFWTLPLVERADLY